MIRSGVFGFTILLQLGVMTSIFGQDNALTPPTIAEKSGFTATATAREVDDFLRQIVADWPRAELTSIGQTVEGRELSSVVIKPGNTAEKPLTVLVLGGIHSGECDGKEGLLALARDLSQGKLEDSLDNLRMIFVPNYNADGNERRSEDHRPGQYGPSQGMGTRENAQGLDLNRDFVKLESPEAQNLIRALNEFDVDVLIDLHTTNGSLHQHDLTYDIPHHPMVPDAMDGWLRDEVMPTVRQRMKDAGYNTFYYGNFNAAHTQWRTYGYEPRYSTDYMGLRGKIGILSESYSYVSYQRRVEASYQFTYEVLKYFDQNAEVTRRHLADTKVKPGDKLPLRGEIVATADDQLVEGYQTPDGNLPSPPYGWEAIARHEPQDYRVELWNTFKATETTEVPFAYAIEPQYAWAAQRLAMHGVNVQVLAEDTQALTTGYHIAEVKKERSFQYHRRLAVELEPLDEDTRRLPAGTFIVRTSQPLGKLAAYLLEPRADDSLVAWNFFDPDIRSGKDYPVLKVREGVAGFAYRDTIDVPATEQITLEHLSHPELSVDYDGDLRRSAHWLGNSTDYVVRAEGEHFVVAAESGAHRRLSELTRLAQALAKLDAFTDEEARAAAKTGALTEDLKHAVVTHSGDLFVYSADDQIARRITNTPEVTERLAELSPDASQIAFVAENDLWVVQLNDADATRITNDGSPEQLNGILDWVYQEELYGRGNFKAFWWSPDSTQLAFLRLDQTQVDRYQVADSISYKRKLEETRYPKAGNALPNVSLWIAKLGDESEPLEVDLSGFPPEDRLISRVSWSPDGTLWTLVQNRVQNKQSLLRVESAADKPEPVLRQESDGWLEIRSEPQFLESGDFLWLSDLPSGRTHLYLVDAQTGEQHALTSGEWDVASIAGVNESAGMAYVTGNFGQPTENHLVSVGIKTGQTQRLTSLDGTHSVKLDHSCQYFIDRFSSLTQPPELAVFSIQGDLVRHIDAPRSNRHAALAVREPVATTIPAADGLPLQSLIMLPPTGIRSPDQKLPVLFFVYGGPQAPTVKNAWAGRNYWWHQMLCSRGFAVVLCDNRSSRGRGVKDTWTIRGDLARVELEDLESAVEWVKQQEWADADRFGIWGWSYGGYFSAYAMTHSTNFKAGIAGAPVTDWRNYDAIYTERYMGLPQENEAGYDSSSVVQAAGDLSGRLMIIHGERDDNVHMSNSLQLAYQLQKAGKTFDLMIYPKNRHGITDPAQRHHLHKTMTEFFERNLK